MELNGIKGTLNEKIYRKLKKVFKIGISSRVLEKVCVQQCENLNCKTF